MSTLRIAALVPLLAAALIGASCSQPAQAPAQTPDRTNADLAFRLGLLSGHLRIGRELIAAGQTRDALPHFGHPVRELYGDLRPVLAARNVPQFDRDLIALESLAASQPRSPEFSARFDQVTAEVAAARASIPAATLSSEAFVLGRAADLAVAAGQEYRNAFIAGRIGSAVEYHDAKGFVAFALAMVRSQDARASTERTRAALADLTRLQAPLAPLNPPDPAIATPDQFDRDVQALRPFQQGEDRAAQQGLS